MADFSYLLKKMHCLMLFSFVSRQRLDLQTELSLTEPAESHPPRRRAPAKAGSPLASLPLHLLPTMKV